MLITPVLVLLLVLLFYKRPVNDVVGWTPPPRTLWQEPPLGLAGPVAVASDAGQRAAGQAARAAAQAGQAEAEVPMDLNDLFGGPNRATKPRS